MKYAKKPISLNEQLIKLKERNLKIDDNNYVINKLSNISYYRLRAYTYPFQDNNDSNHPFIEDISFKEIISLYNFDSKLRNLILCAIEKIEISFRTQIIYKMSMTYGSHWYLDINNFRNAYNYRKNERQLKDEIQRSNEKFLIHYFNKYNSPADPPSWMSLEVISFGLLSLLFHNIKLTDEKKSITRHYGIWNVKILENWMHSLSQVRNVCAHHSRLWNRRLPILITIPKKTINRYVINRNFHNNKLYAYLTVIQYLLNIIDDSNNFGSKLISLIKSCSLDQEKAMGFPVNWNEDEFWSN